MIENKGHGNARTDRGAVRHAPWRRRVHPNDVGVRRPPALHRGAAGRATFSRADSAARRCLGPRVILGASTYLFMICSFPLQVKCRTQPSSQACLQGSDLVRSAIRRRVLRTRPLLRPGRGAALTQARSRSFRAEPKMGSPEPNEPTASKPRLRRAGRRLGPDRELPGLPDRHQRHGTDGARLQSGAEIRGRDGDPG